MNTSWIIISITYAYLGVQGRVQESQKLNAECSIVDIVVRFTGQILNLSCDVLFTL